MAKPVGKRHETVRGALLLPFHVAALVAVLGLFISLLLLAYTTWSFAQRLVPLEHHLMHMQELENASAGIQNILVQNMESGGQPAATEIADISRQIERVLKDGDTLQPDTLTQLKQAQGFLQDTQTNDRAGLLAALSVIRAVLATENDMQHSTVQAVHDASWHEVTIAIVTLLLLPLSAILLLGYVRHRTIRPLQSLSELLENVGNLDFSSTQLPKQGDAFYPVYERYNRMTEQLKHVSHENAELQANLQAQVRAATETLLRQQRDLDDSAQLAAIGEFSARIAHELRNPLSGILLALRNMEQESEDPDAKQRYNAIIDEIERIKRLLAALLQKAPQAPETPVSLDLSALVSDVVMLFRYQSPEDIDIRQIVEVGQCRLPRDTIRQVLLNLLRNSVQALTPNPGVITIDAHQVDKQLHIYVTDTGPGYPEELLNHGVRPFWTQKTGGSGLGLAVVQRLIRSVGGELQLSNLAEGGACAKFVMPCEMD